MKIHPGVKPAVWGAVVGAVAFAVVGFSQLGWTLGSTAEKMATQRAETAVVAALAPICVERFQQQTDAAAKLVAFNKVSSSWDRRVPHREGRLGYHAWKRHTEFGSCERLRRKARQLDLETRPRIGLRRGLMTGAAGASI